MPDEKRTPISDAAVESRLAEGSAPHGDALTEDQLMARPEQHREVARACGKGPRDADDQRRRA